MKTRDVFLLLLLLSCSTLLIAFSADAKAGAKAGLLLAENTVLPSLLPLLMLFLMIMKSRAGHILTRLFGGLTDKGLRLPAAAFPALLFGLVGGYPTGAVLTQTLYRDGEISQKQAQRIMRFNVCGGAGFIITAVGTVTLSSQSSGLLLFASNVLSSLIIAGITAIKQERDGRLLPGMANTLPISDALTYSASEGMKSLLNITAYIILFSALDGVLHIPKPLEPLFEITNGLCTGTAFTLPQTAAFLSFGGFCIHLQLLGIIKEFHMRYMDFLVHRILSACLSYAVCRGLLYLFPQKAPVFSNVSETVAQPSIVNTALSVLLLLGCVVLVFDLHAKRRKV